MEKGSVKTYNWVIQLLQACDFEEQSKKRGLTRFSADKAFIDFLGRTYEITKRGITLIEENIVWVHDEDYEYNLKSVLGYYLLSDADVVPMNEYCPLTHFSHGIFNEFSGWQLFLHNKFADVYGNNHEKIKTVLDTFGMEYREEQGRHTWTHRILPRMPIKLIYYEGDEEFPAKLQMLYDKTAIQIYNFEQLSVLHVSIVQAIIARGT